MTTIPFDDKRWQPLDAKYALEGTVGAGGRTLDAKTGRGDWWRTTERDSRDGPTLGFSRSSKDAFEVSVEMELEPQVQYVPRKARRATDDSDQLAVFLHVAPTLWVKAGIEFDNGAPWNAVVVCNPYSDWSLFRRTPTDARRFTLAYRPGLLEVYLGDDMVREVKWFGATRDNDAVEPPAGEVFVGVMACSPKGGGASAKFKKFKMREGVREKQE